MKFSSPLPQPLSKECAKAAKIFNSFVTNGNQGLDGIIPRHVLENAKGFAIFTVIKAGFLFSARAGSGIVIAKLPDGTWSCPSAIGTGGLGVGGQAGAEMTDFLIVLNSRSSQRSFMSAGSFTLGGNMSIALGPLGRNGEASGSLNTSGKLAAMYSYSKTRGLFGGLSIEGSVIVERQDANALAYGSDVTAKQLLSGVIEHPDWAKPLIKTLEACIGMPGGRKWIDDSANSSFQGEGGYAFNSPSAVSSPGSETSPSSSRKKRSTSTSFPPSHWGKPKSDGSYFESASDPVDNLIDDGSAANGFATRFDSDFKPTHRTTSSLKTSQAHTPSFDPGSPFNDLPPFPKNGLQGANSHNRSFSSASYFGQNGGERRNSHNPFSSGEKRNDPFVEDNLWEDAELSSSFAKTSVSNDKPFITPKPGLKAPLSPLDGVGRAIALYSFDAVQSGDLSFKKGQVITITQKTDKTDDWWTGKLEGREGIFPANFVEVV
ncbi:DUF500-domain-containing protein [Schizopora paradoxa]|uniref:DUF500-domain-containing protein n=1 Tax=Schizopora paradoxa TaxID=27342 RepID=A0A0H2SS95_9AGAM|nr:DUF500-domain-containing protein [Schizopora paradoxa]